MKHRIKASLWRIHLTTVLKTANLAFAPFDSAAWFHLLLKYYTKIAVSLSQKEVHLSSLKAQAAGDRQGVIGRPFTARLVISPYFVFSVYEWLFCCCGICHG